MSFVTSIKQYIDTDMILIGKYNQARYLCETNNWATHYTVDQNQCRYNWAVGVVAKGVHDFIELIAILILRKNT